LPDGGVDGELHAIISAIISTQLNKTVRSPVQQILFMAHLSVEHGLFSVLLRY